MRKNTEVKKGMTAEAKPTVAEAADLPQVLAYLQERERELSKYSDKLRESVKRVISVFGDSDECQVCGKHEEVYSEGDIKNHEEATGHKFVPKVYVSIFVLDNEPFYTVEDFELRLALVNGKLVAWDSRGGEYNAKHHIGNLAREHVKALVKSGRLIPFLQKVKQELDETTQEYRQVAQVAEKLADALKQGA